MSERFILDDNHELIGITPVLVQRTDTVMVTIYMDYENTRLRLFENELMDHVEYHDPDGGIFGMYFDEFDEHNVKEHL